MTTTEKVMIGMLGGLAAVCVKFLGQDYHIVVTQAADLTAKQILSYKIGYALLTPMLMFLGALLSWVAEETDRLKLLAISVAAPALITTWAGGGKPNDVAFNINPASSAYAGEVENSANRDDKSAINNISDGVKIFFGYGKEVQHYWVIVGSYKDRKLAQQFADAINVRDRELGAFVGYKTPPNEYYPVIVGGYVPLSDANKIKKRALNIDIVKDAYLSANAAR